MFEKSVWNLEKALLLDNTVVGIRFLRNKVDYEQLTLPVVKGKVNFCYMVRRAIRGKHFKAYAVNFRCSNALYSLGLVKPDHHVTSGELLSICGLYETPEIAKKVIDHMQYPNQENYGIEIGPLKCLDQADMVIIIADARKCMRIFQGYTYKYGPPKHLLSMGNQAMCSDLVAKPLFNNDINFSFLCRGARLFGQCDSGDLGIGMPASIFEDVTDGVIKTLTPVETDKVKTQILQNLDNPDDLGTEIKMGVNYAQTIAEYLKKLN